MSSSQTENQTAGAAVDAIVVGAGIIGLAIAWELHRRGVRVRVFERDRPGLDATHVAAGMLAPVGELDFGEPDLLAMNLESARIYPEFLESIETASGLEAGLLNCGALHVALDRDEAGELRRVREMQVDHGLDSVWLGPGAARELEPGVSPSLTGAVLVESDSVVDPRAATAALEVALERAGVPVATGIEVTDLIRTGDGAVEGVELADGNRYLAPTVIAAPGPEAGRAAWLPAETRPPVRPVKGQVVELQGSATDPACSRILGSERVYVVPRPDGRLILGATVEEMGFDRRVTAGGIHELLREAYRLLPEIAELEFLAAIAGLRPGSPDNVPIIGPTSVEGLLLATGHYRNGILLAPITARAIADLVTNGRVEGPVKVADPGRFTDRSRNAGRHNRSDLPAPDRPDAPGTPSAPNHSTDSTNPTGPWPEGAPS